MKYRDGVKNALWERGIMRRKGIMRDHEDDGIMWRRGFMRGRVIMRRRGIMRRRRPFCTGCRMSIKLWVLVMKL